MGRIKVIECGGLIGSRKVALICCDGLFLSGKNVFRRSLDLSAFFQFGEICGVPLRDLILLS